MKQNFIIPILLITILGDINCKKNNTSYSSITPAAGKKWRVTTVAGDGRAVLVNGAALSASFKDPLDVVLSEDETIYVADALSHCIRKIANGQVFTFAGSGTSDTTSGIGPAAGFILPDQLATDKNGNLFTLDIQDPRLRKISPASFVSVYAGTGVKGFADGSADVAQFGEEAAGIATDKEGNIYVSDYDNKRIRKVNISGEVSTLAGNGQEGFINGKADTSQFFAPSGIVIDKQGNLFVADFNRVRKITPSGMVSTFAGSDSSGYKDGKDREAQFSFIIDMTIDESDNIYLTDENRIRKITSQGLVSTLAGSIAGYEDGDATSAKFSNPAGLGIDKQGNIYVADSNNKRIRKISFE
jgi:serine/threonine-protein kinase